MRFLHNKGFTLLEILAVLAILALVSAVSVPLVQSSIRNTYAQSIKNEMLTIALDLNNYISESESTKSFVEDISFQSYNSPYTVDNQLLKNKVEQLFSFPSYLAVEISCEVINYRKVLVACISYPGFNEESNNLVFYRNLSVKEIANTNWPSENNSIEWNDAVGCLWQAFNDKNIIPNKITKTSIAVSTIIYELNPNNNHTPYTIHKLQSLAR